MTDTRVRKYSNWTKPHVSGLGKLSRGVTLFLLGGLAVSFLMFFIAWWAVLVSMAVVGGVTWALSRKDQDDTNIFGRMGERMRFTNARSNKSHLYRSGPLSRVPWGTHQLPGVAAESKLFEMNDSSGRPFGLIYWPSTGHFTAVISTQPDGASLVDQEQIDNWVANFGAWLASLADEPGLVGASITVEAAPDAGYALQQQVEAAMDADAPAFARRIVDDILVEYPQGASRIAAYVALSFDASQLVPSSRRRELEEVGAAIANRMTWLTGALEATGAGWAAPATASQLCEEVRIAYDPAVAFLLDEVRNDGGEPDLRWKEVGPAAHEAGWDYFRHDSAISKTWTMSGAPRGWIREQVLSRLLAPNARIERKRVTLHYRPIDPGDAAEIVERDTKDATSAALSVGATAKTQRRLGAARDTENEEASGAALTMFGMSVTATVTSEANWAELDSVVKSLAKTARIRLRPAYGSQDSAFAATLPLGIVPPRHVSVAKEFGAF